MVLTGAEQDAKFKLTGQSKMGTKHLSEKERRRQIIEAARRVFLRKGYYKTRMDDIVKEAGLSKGTIYWYFKSKRDVFNAIYKEWFQESLEKLLPIIASKKTARSRLYELGLEVIKLIESEPESFRAMLELYIQALDSRKSWRLLQEFYKDAIAKLEMLIQEGIKRKEFRPDLDIRSTSLFIIQNLDLLDLIPMLGVEIDLKKHWDEVFRIITKGITTPARSQARRKR